MFSGKLKLGLSDGSVILHLSKQQRITTFNREEGSTTTHLHLLQLSFQLFQSDGRQREGNHHHLLLTSVDKQGLPEWLERSGAPEAIEVGADLRGRYDKLKLDSG